MGIRGSSTCLDKNGNLDENGVFEKLVDNTVRLLFDATVTGVGVGSGHCLHMLWNVCMCNEVSCSFLVA